MKKKVFKIIICFLTTISFFLIDSKINATSQKISVNQNGVPSTGGSDPCDSKKSLVCIYNLAAVRISYYEGTTFKKAIDFYSDEAYEQKDVANFKKNNQSLKTNIKENKKGKEISGSAMIDLGSFSAKQFVSADNQKKFYRQVLSEIEKQTKVNGEYRLLLIEEILKKMGYNAANAKAKSVDSNGRFVVEPLFRFQIQKQSDALQHQGNWIYGTGTAYTVAREVTYNYYYKNCMSSLNNTGKCMLGWQTRSDKRHVGRMANSLHFTSDWNGISKVSQLKKGDSNYSMSTLNNNSKGYGMAVINFKKPQITKGNIAQYCYSLDNDDCNPSDNDYDISVKVGNKLDGYESCVNAETDSNLTVSEFGAVEKGNNGAAIINNNYCALFCEKEINFDLPEFGQKEGTEKPNIATIDTSDQYKIVKKTSYNCKVDFKYYYTSDNNEINDIWTTYGSTAGNNFRPTKAQGELAVKINDLRDFRENNSTILLVCGAVDNNQYGLKDCYDKMDSEIALLENLNATKDQYNTTDYISPMNDLKAYKSKYEAWLSLWGAISNAYRSCATSTLDKNKFAVSSGTVKVSDTDGNTYELSAQGDTTITVSGGEQVTVESDLDKIVSNENCENSTNEYIKKYKTVCGVNFLERMVDSRNRVTATSQMTWQNKKNIKVNFNSEDPNKGEASNPSYSTITDKKTIDLASGTLNYCKWDLKKYNSIFGSNGSNNGKMQNKITFDFSKENDIKACINKNTAEIIINKSDSQKDCACPPNTTHSGTNSYYWLDNDLLPQTWKEKFMDGITCTEAQALVCDSDLPSSESGYEEVKNGKNCSMQDCLQAGNPYEYCSMMACNSYACNIEIAGKKAEIYTQEDVYQKIHDKYKDDLSTLNNKDENSAITEANQIAKEICQKRQCDDSNKNKELFVYRTVELNDGKDLKVSFPGISGNGRSFGSNWSKDSALKILDKSRVNESSPIYIIELKPSDIQHVREYNKNYSYNNIANLKCNENGAACISDFLRGNIISVTGKCANINQSNFYSCTNY